MKTPAMSTLYIPADYIPVGHGYIVHHMPKDGQATSAIRLVQGRAAFAFLAVIPEENLLFVYK
jgi:hypothetical protein